MSSIAVLMIVVKPWSWANTIGKTIGAANTLPYNNIRICASNSPKSRQIEATDVLLLGFRPQPSSGLSSGQTISEIIVLSSLVQWPHELSANGYRMVIPIELGKRAVEHPAILDISQDTLSTAKLRTRRVDNQFSPKKRMNNHQSNKPHNAGSTNCCRIASDYWGLIRRLCG